MAAAAAGDDDGDYDDDDNDLSLFSSLSCPPGSEGLELSISARPPSHRMQGRQIPCSGPAAFIQAHQKARRPAHKKEVLVSLGSRNCSGVRLLGNCFPVLDQHRERPGLLICWAQGPVFGGAHFQKGKGPSGTSTRGHQRQEATGLLCAASHHPLLPVLKYGRFQRKAKLREKDSRSSSWSSLLPSPSAAAAARAL